MANLVRLAEIAIVSQGLGTSGQAAGARRGDWTVQVVSVGNIQDDRLALDVAETIAIEQNVKTEKHLLQPDDVLVTARSTVLKAALVPPSVSRTVADATLLVVRPRDPDLGPYLWWFLTSTGGRRQVLARMTGSTTLLSLSAATLAEVEVPIPTRPELYRIVDLIEASERAYVSAIEAAGLRRTAFRDAVIDGLRSRARDKGVDA